MTRYGSEAHPWTTITEAVAAAAPAGLVAIARGAYNEDVLITSKPVRLWGVCADEAEIVAAGQDPSGPCPPTAVCISDGAHGAEVHSLGLTGAAFGVLVAGTDDVLIDRVRVHDTDERGIDVEKYFGSGSLTLRDSLVEQSQWLGVYVAGASATIERSVVRATRPSGTDAFGRGINVEGDCSETPTGAVCDPAVRASAVVRGSVVEDNHELGVFVMGSDATIEASVIRATRPNPSKLTAGRGLMVQLSCVDTPTGRECDPATRANAAVLRSLVEDNYDVGVFVAGSGATVEGSFVRATAPQLADSLFGDGLAVYSEFAPASARLTGVLIEDSARSGLSTFGGSVSLGATRIRCAAFELAADPLAGHDFCLDDRGDNLCGCPTAEGDCSAVSAGLEPPEPY